jgi:hypothetical protein
MLHLLVKWLHFGSNQLCSHHVVVIMLGGVYLNANSSFWNASTACNSSISRGMLFYSSILDALVLCNGSMPLSLVHTATPSKYFDTAGTVALDHILWQARNIINISSSLAINLDAADMNIAPSIATS